MPWNYRVVRVDGELRIYDVYYDDAGHPKGRGEPPSHVYGETLEDLREHLNLFFDALEDPVLEDAEIGSVNQEPSAPSPGESN